MALRKRGLKVAVTAMAIISVITSGGLNNIYADGSIDKNVTVIERTLEENSKPKKVTDSYAKNPTEAGLVILARSCFATPNVNNQEGSMDYYKNIDITKVVSLIPYY